VTCRWWRTSATNVTSSSKQAVTTASRGTAKRRWTPRRSAAVENWSRLLERLALATSSRPPTTEVSAATQEALRWRPAGRSVAAADVEDAAGTTAADAGHTARLRVPSHLDESYRRHWTALAHWAPLLSYRRLCSSATTPRPPQQSPLKPRTVITSPICICPHTVKSDPWLWPPRRAFMTYGPSISIANDDGYLWAIQKMDPLNTMKLPAGLILEMTYHRMINIKLLRQK